LNVRSLASFPTSHPKPEPIALSPLPLSLCRHSPTDSWKHTDNYSFILSFTNMNSLFLRTLAFDHDPCTPPIELEGTPEVEYAPGSLFTDFGTETFATGAANIEMLFDRALPDDHADKLSLEAIVFGNTECTGDAIANTPGAVFSDANTAPSQQVFDLSFSNDDYLSTQPMLSFIANLENFASPFFEPTDQCINSGGGDLCGSLTYCVEVQSLYCDFKYGTVTVAVELDLGDAVTTRSAARGFPFQKIAGGPIEVDGERNGPGCFVCKFFNIMASILDFILSFFGI